MPKMNRNQTFLDDAKCKLVIAKEDNTLPDCWKDLMNVQSPEKVLEPGIMGTYQIKAYRLRQNIVTEPKS